MTDHTTEFTLYTKGYFDFSSTNTSSYNLLMRKWTETFGDKAAVRMLPTGTPPNQSARFFSDSNSSFYVNFDNGFVAYTFLSRGPEDNLDFSSFIKSVESIEPIVKKAFDLKYTQMVIEEVHVYTDVEKEFVETACHGRTLPEAYLPVEDWTISLRKKIITEPFSKEVEKTLTLDQTIQSSTLLRNNERVLVTRFSISTATSNNAPRFDYQDMQNFLSIGKGKLDIQRQEFDQKWKQ